jgi:hypothetical protein
MSRNQLLIAGLTVALAGAGVAAFADDDKQDRTYATGSGARIKTAETVLADWPAKPREVAETTIAKYGQPDEVTASMLIWHQNGPWKRTVVHREEVAHDFPKPHTDIVEQFIDYQVPTDKVDDIVAYDGSVVVKRTEGELSARCDNEAMNFLALNLAVEIASGKKDVAEARAAYHAAAMQKMKSMKNKKVAAPELTAGLQFELPEGETGDRDKPFKPAKR